MTLHLKGLVRKKPELGGEKIDLKAQNLDRVSRCREFVKKMHPEFVMLTPEQKAFRRTGADKPVRAGIQAWLAA